MVARRARLEAARAGEVGRDAAAERRPALARAQQRAEIGRLEGERLAVLGEAAAISESAVPGPAVSTSSSGS